MGSLDRPLSVGDHEDMSPGCSQITIRMGGRRDRRNVLFNVLSTDQGGFNTSVVRVLSTDQGGFDTSVVRYFRF